MESNESPMATLNFCKENRGALQCNNKFGTNITNKKSADRGSDVLDGK